MNTQSIKSYTWIVPFFSFIIGYGILHYIFHVPYIETPALVGKTLDQAMPLVTEGNINLRLLYVKDDVDAQEGTILDQTPSPYQKMRPHQSIFVVIAKKPLATRVPCTYHKTVDVVTSELAACGITPQVVYILGNYPEAQCIAQTPAAGDILRDGRMLIYVSDDTDGKVIWPLFIGKRVLDVKEFLTSYGIPMEVTHSYAQPVNHTCADCLVVDQRPLPGSLINFKNPNRPLRVHIQAN